MYKKGSFILLALLFAIDSFGQKPNLTVAKALPRNIIVIVANGMGMNQIAAATLKKEAALTLSGFPVTGFSQPWPPNGKQPTDSTSARAIGTNRPERVGKDFKTKTLFSLAKDRKMLTGLIVTGPVTEPTAKTLVFNTPDKKDNEALALDYVNADLNILIGGGSKYFNKRYDGRNLFNDFKTKGYDINYKLTSLKTAGTTKTIALVEKDGIYRASERKDFLTKSALFAMRTMQQPAGYFLVIDDTKIAEADSLHNTRLLTEEILDLDKLIASLNDQIGGETLVVVIGNYECGGLELKNANIDKNSEPNAIWNTKTPTPALAPVYAKGPGSNQFSGMYSQAEIYAKLEALIAK